MKEQEVTIMNEFQPSMTEWFASIGEKNESAAFRQEDNTKDSRLEILYQTIGVEYERATNFPARAVADKSPEFLEFLSAHGEELCALRLVPHNAELPKLRNRGLSVSKVCETWFSKQDIDVDQYEASFRPHAGTYPWSLIFVIGVGGAFGEIVTGQHAQLTHGDTLTSTSTFKTDFSSWEWRNEHAGARDIMIRALDILNVTDEDTRAVLEGKLDATFTNNHLDGYYEAILWGDDIIRFGDYNRVLQKRIPVPAFLHRNESALAGMVASVGTARGIVRIVEIDQIGTVEFNTGDILVTDNTDVRFVGLMQKAGAIVTDRGGILSHASIVARELKKPCIVGTGNATTILKNGDFVEVDAFTGVVNILTKG